MRLLTLLQIALLLHGEQIVTIILIVLALTFSGLLAITVWLVYGILRQRKKITVSESERKTGNIATSQNETYNADEAQKKDGSHSMDFSSNDENGQRK